MNALVTLNSNLSISFMSREKFKEKVNIKSPILGVVVSAWDENDLDSCMIRKLVLRLNSCNCFLFACVGTKAEQLHDLIDDIIIDNNLSRLGLMTTWHSQKESVDDFAHFFLNCPSYESGLLLALLENNKNDQKIKKALLSKAKQLFRS